MPCIVFETPDLIDLRSFSMMGVSAKPKSANPIGYFGTGLKYSMAVLIRLGCQPVVWIGDDRYTFFKRPDQFRGTEIEKISMRRESFKLTRSRVTDLPFAISYGRNWKPWMVVRELESNTRDEGGRSYRVESNKENVGPEASATKIVVDLPEFLEAFEKLDDIFLPSAQREGTGIQTVDEESKSLYWRGLKVMSMHKPSLVTYNVLDPVELTEDRTIMYEFLVKGRVSAWLCRHDDEALIERVLTADEKYWEHGMEFNQDVAPSAAFHRVMLRHPKNMNVNAGGYYSRWDERVVDRTFDVFEAHPRPWRIEGTVVVDREGKGVFDAPYGYKGKWELAAAGILRQLGMGPEVEQKDEEPEVPHDADANDAAYDSESQDASRRS